MDHGKDKTDVVSFNLTNIWSSVLLILCLIYCKPNLMVWLHEKSPL